MYRRGDVEIVRYCYYVNVDKLYQFTPRHNNEEEFAYRSRVITSYVPWYKTKSLTIDEKDKPYLRKFTREIYIFYKNYYSNLIRLLLSYSKEEVAKLFTELPETINLSDLQAAMSVSLLIRNSEINTLEPVFFTNYDTAIALENDMRENMYVTRDEKYYQPHYGLIQLTEELWDAICKTTKVRTPDMLFDKKPKSKQLYDKRSHWDTIQNRLQQLKPLFTVPGVFVAGGAIFSILSGGKIKDIDIFFYDQGNLEERIKQLMGPMLKTAKQLFIDARSHKTLFIRTKNSLTITTTGQDFQIILRHYSTPSEIIHGFDVDSCCMGYDGKNIWFTQRALFALYNGYNTVNFERLSPSYEHRLAKYGTRGMAVRIPGFHRAKISNLSKLNRVFRSYKGLDILILADYLFQNKLTKTVRSDNVSDYNGYDGKVGGQQLKYQFRKMGISVSSDFEKIDTNWIVDKKHKLNYIRTSSLDYALHIPSNVYGFTADYATWAIPKDISWKVTNPGEQMTNTFHQIILKDNSVWYKGKLYNPE